LTTDEAKDEVMRLIGPTGQMLEALRKRGFKLVDYADDGTILTIQFLVTEAFGIKLDWWAIEQNLTICGENVKLKLTEFQRRMHSTSVNLVHHICTTKFVWPM
jgi:hypothetical protein